MPVKEKVGGHRTAKEKPLCSDAVADGCERKEAGKLEPGGESLRGHAGLAESGPTR